jgi:hypothetical protein
MGDELSAPVAGLDRRPGGDEILRVANVAAVQRMANGSVAATFAGVLTPGTVESAGLAASSVRHYPSPSKLQCVSRNPGLVVEVVRSTTILQDPSIPIIYLSH